MSLRHVAYEHIRLDVKHNFMELKVGEVDRTHGYNCRTIPRSKSLHYVRSISHANNVLLETREFSCFCDKCVDDIAEGNCDSKLHVSPWTLLTLQPCNSLMHTMTLRQMELVGEMMERAMIWLWT